MTPTRLKPCPFCGSPVTRSYDQSSDKVVYLCSNPACGAEVAFWSAYAGGREDHDRLWDSRAATAKEEDR